ncbi:hypothetical protein [Metabacillus sp. 84]|uniref:hypothetical protein n=1 Tax=unclassified Metabacillus TaxID=2675274 RepID=UPI003CF7DE80
MDVSIQKYFHDLKSKDKEVQYAAYQNLLSETEKEVDWAYEVWEQLLQDLSSPDPHSRSRAAQFLARLAISDPEKRMLRDFSRLWEAAKDPKFVTARHSLQVIWRVGLAGKEQQRLVLEHFTDRFTSCREEKNHTLIRFDIIQGLRLLYDEVKREEIKQSAHGLIAKEEDIKYQKKYAAVWKNT